MGVPALIITISDTGIGMTPEQKARLFTAFTRADGATRAKYGGTGLGLALSGEFCRMMGGEITVERAPGVGSSFTFWLPAVVRADARRESSGDGEAPSG